MERGVGIHQLCGWLAGNGVASEQHGGASLGSLINVEGD